MTFRLVKQVNKDCRIMWLILILFVSLCLICNFLYKNRSSEFFNNKKDISYNLGICSKDCCSTQWPVPINQTAKSTMRSKYIKSKYITSNLTCNNGIKDTDCVCLTKESKKLLSNRGYVKQLPMGNGLLDSDNKQSVWQIMDNKIDKPLELGQTTQLTGNPKQQTIISGIIKDKTLKQSLIQDEKDITMNYTIPIDNNVINWDNEKINDALTTNIRQSNNLTKTDNLLKNPLGVSTLRSNIK